MIKLPEKLQSIENKIHYINYFVHISSAIFIMLIVFKGNQLTALISTIFIGECILLFLIFLLSRLKTGKLDIANFILAGLSIPSTLLYSCIILFIELQQYFFFVTLFWAVCAYIFNNSITRSKTLQWFIVAYLVLNLLVETLFIHSDTLGVILKSIVTTGSIIIVWVNSSVMNVYRERLESVIEMSQNISSILKIQELLDHVINKAIEVTGAQKGILFLKNKANGTLEIRASRSVVQNYSNSVEFPIEIIETVYQTGMPYLSQSAGRDIELSPQTPSTEYTAKSILCAPMLFRQETIGVCYLDNSKVSGVFNTEDLALLDLFINQSAIAIENAYIVENLERLVNERTVQLEAQKNSLKARNELIEQDLALARQFQQHLIPGLNPSDQIAFYYQSNENIGGVFFDFLTYSDKNWIGFFMSDTSAHGVQAALISSIIKSTLLQNSSEHENPAFLLQLLNDSLYNHTGGHFITVFYGIYVPNSRRFLFANAGHNPPFLVRGESVTQIRAENSSMPLGVLGKQEMLENNLSYTNKSIQLEKESKIVFYSDGLTETTGKDNPEIKFETAQLNPTFQQLSSTTADRFVQETALRLKEFHGKDSFKDDVCIICLNIA